jgi:hypothetical protein
VFREADTRDIDIDSVEHVDTESEGTTMRVLYEDAPDEKDQIGFQVTKPPGPMGDQMFGEQLQNGFRELRNYLRGTDTDAESDGDTETETETNDTPSPSGSDTGTSPSPSRTDDTAEPADTSEPTTREVTRDVEHVVTLETTLADADHEALRTAMAELGDNFQMKEERIDELQQEVDTLEDRVDKLESVIENIGSGLSALTEDDAG